MLLFTMLPHAAVLAMYVALPIKIICIMLKPNKKELYYVVIRIHNIYNYIYNYAP